MDLCNILLMIHITVYHLASVTVLVYRDLSDYRYCFTQRSLFPMAFYRHYCPGTPVLLVGMKKDLRQSTDNSRSLVPEDTARQVAKEIGKM